MILPPVILPPVIAHADWGIDRRKRQMAAAGLVSGSPHPGQGIPGGFTRTRTGRPRLTEIVAYGTAVVVRPTA